MHRLGHSSIAVVGLGGIGLEVAKNLVLGGAKKVTLVEWQSASFADLASNFYLSEPHVFAEKNRRLLRRRLFCHPNNAFLNILGQMLV